jgi:AhpD family alkylhydroperoxidase
VATLRAPERNTRLSRGLGRRYGVVQIRTQNRRARHRFIALGPGPQHQEWVDGIAQKNGKAIKIQRVLAHSPAAVQAYLGMNGALAQENGCGYCLAAHTFLGGKAGLSEDEILAARRGEAWDEKERAVVEFAQTMDPERANVSDGDVQRLRDAGLSEAEVVEVVANAVLNIFTNYINHVADTPVDFPAAAGLEPAAR